jgi:hypothetical protein
VLDVERGGERRGKGMGQLKLIHHGRGGGTSWGQVLTGLDGWMEEMGWELEKGDGIKGNGNETEQKKYRWTPE